MMKVVIHPRFESLRTFIAQLPECFSAQGETIYKDRNELKCYRISDFDIVVKSYRKPFFINRIVYTYFRQTKAQRAYNYALQLLKLGLNSPLPIAYIEQYRLNLLTHTYFVSIFEKDYSNIRELMEGSQTDDSLLKELAIYICELHDKGVLHLDLSPGNVMYRKTDEKVSFSLIDINRMQFCSKITNANRFRNFKRLTENKEVLHKLAKYYAAAAGLNPTLAIDEISGYSTRFFNARNRKYKDA